ncbi:ThiF family adenylyltransferase [Tenacibaculum ovolyticum]|uniref:ThiF family adenylyltransferase n=1 Tax=Tenacibaculum ovolyticum TaxID=104270 RepID=UPI001EEE3353|nr:ThiF family adenylyltransferase [Tenacibaculum ovolyticum]
MKQDYKESSGQELKIDELKNEHSKQIVSSIYAFDNTIKLLRVSNADGQKEFIHLNILPDIPNNPIIDIRQEEHIVIITSINNRNLPKVYAIRKDFPLGLPHTNITNDERPVSLCLFEETFEELKHNWSGSFFLQSIKNWLELTAIDALHQEDQHLEPFIIGDGGMIMGNNNHKFFDKLSDNFYRNTSNPVKKRFHKILLSTTPLENGVVHQRVDNLFDLSELFFSKGIDFKGLLKPKILELGELGLALNKDRDFWEAILFMNVIIPIVRDGNQTEPTLICFKVDCTLGAMLNMYGFSILGTKNIHQTGEKFLEEKLKVIQVELLNPIPDLDIEWARKYSGTENSNGIDSKISLIGVGALGSQFFMNLARNGFGSWNLIDKDILLPHNFIRHASTNIQEHTSLNKAEALSKEANELLSDTEFSKSFPSSITSLDKAILEQSDVIIDMSTSIGVERYLANEIKGPRKLSSFLSPSGTDLVMLTEDKDSISALDTLEIQYYKELIRNPNLASHLEFEQSGKIRYARGCRDITSKIPQENLSIFSGISAKNFKNKLSSITANIEIWRLDESQGVKHFNFTIDKWDKVTISDWTVLINENHLLNIISSHRNNKLPNETGGILIGTVDTYYKKIYITDTILSPKDSIERPTLFIRGIDGVPDELERISQITNQNLKYLGEWHSHPKHCSLNMSEDDKIQFTELTREAELIGQPALMLIIGDNGKFEIYLNNLKI